MIHKSVLQAAILQAYVLSYSDIADGFTNMQPSPPPPLPNDVSSSSEGLHTDHPLHL